MLRTWERVTYYRSHLNEVEFLKKIVTKRKRYFRYKSGFSVNKLPDGSDICDKKVLFLNDIKLTDSDESQNVEVSADLFID